MKLPKKTHRFITKEVHKKLSRWTIYATFVLMIMQLIYNLAFLYQIRHLAVPLLQYMHMNFEIHEIHEGL